MENIQISIAMTLISKHIIFFPHFFISKKFSESLNDIQLGRKTVANSEWKLVNMQRLSLSIKYAL